MHDPQKKRNKSFIKKVRLSTVNACLVPHVHALPYPPNCLTQLTSSSHGICSTFTWRGWSDQSCKSHLWGAGTFSNEEGFSNTVLDFCDILFPWRLCLREWWGFWDFCSELKLPPPVFSLCSWILALLGFLGFPDLPPVVGSEDMGGRSSSYTWWVVNLLRMFWELLVGSCKSFFWGPGISSDDAGICREWWSCSSVFKFRLPLPDSHCWCKLALFSLATSVLDLLWMLSFLCCSKVLDGMKPKGST